MKEYGSYLYEQYEERSNLLYYGLSDWSVLDFTMIAKPGRFTIDCFVQTTLEE
jgi:hypothetical protein